MKLQIPGGDFSFLPLHAVVGQTSYYLLLGGEFFPWFSH